MLSISVASSFAAASGLGIFPYRLQQILAECEDSGNEHIMSWLPCGRLFKVHDQKEFVRVIMPKYFRHSRYKSFLRQLSMYKFQRITEGPNRGAYGHPQFLRGRADLCRYINRAEKIALDVVSQPVPKQQSMIGSPVPSTSAMTAMPPSLASNSDSEEEFLDFDLAAENFSVSDRKLLQNIISWSSQSSTPADILDEIITTFNGTQPSFASIEENAICFVGDSSVF